MGEIKTIDIPLTGKLNTATDPMKLQPNDFQSLINMRPTDDSPKGVRGMTKISTSPTGYLGIKNGYHFKKDQPAEDHIIVQTNSLTSTTDARLVKSDNTTDIPAQDTFSAFLTLDNNNACSFSKAPDGAVAICNSNDNYIWGGNESRCYGFIRFNASDETQKWDYTDVVNNTLTDSLNVAKMTKSSGATTVYIGATRPLKGVKMYVGTANDQIAAASGTYWNGSWTALSSFTDNTKVLEKTLAQTGTITWADTQSDAKVKIINNQQYYWYKLTFTGINDLTTIYYCTVDAEIQPISDIWDESLRTCLSMMTYQSAYADYTLQVYKNDYYSTDTSTYVDLNGMTSSDYFIVGFIERTMAIYVGLADGYANTTAATTCTISYWNGSAWVSVGTLSDGTSQGAISLSTSGIISWDAPTASSEFTWTPNNGALLYYYKIAFDKTITNGDTKVYLNYIAGIPAQTPINSYRFPIHWQNRLWLCGDQSGRKNCVRYSSMDTNCVFNGTDSSILSIGNDEELMAGATLFTRFGGDIYDSMVLCKKGQTFLVDTNTNASSTSSSFLVRTVSTNKGCVAPYTMKLCDIGFDVANNIRKHILIWLSDSGLMVFDGVSMGTISDYFGNIFDPLDDLHINNDEIHKAFGEYDSVNQEYILIIALTDTADTWYEIHYRLKQQSAFYVNRGTAKWIRSVWPVEDASGIKYLYAGTQDGYIERLEYGQTMDGNAIAHTMHLADLNPTKTALRKSRIHAIQLIGKVIDPTDPEQPDVTVTHYVDGSETGTTVSSAIVQGTSGNRIFRAYIPTKGVIPDGVFHSTKFTVTSASAPRGFEPLLVSYKWSDEGEVVD